MKKTLTIDSLIIEAEQFCALNSGVYKTELFGVTDGKAVGTFVEHLFQQFLEERYEITTGNSASGLDLPSVNTNALQWRLQYGRIVSLTDKVNGIEQIIKFSK